MEDVMWLDAPAKREMPAQIRAFDWATTELGAIERWPASLVTIVDVLTAAAWPMLVWWGEESIQIHNDATRRGLLADRHPHALGAPAAEVWARAWDKLGPAVMAVRAGGGSVVLDDLPLDDRRRCSFALGPVPDGRGGVGGVLVIARETTTSTSLLEVHREHLRSLFMNAPSPIAILRGPQYIVELANEAMAAAFDRRPADVQGRPTFEVVPETRPIFEPLLAAILAGETRTLKELQYRTEVAADGTILGRYANGLFAPLRDLSGNIEGVLIIAVEITDEIRARNEMQRLRGEAEAANRAKDEFLAMLGHELRNPLSPISTALQVMRLRGMAGHELDVLERQVGHLTRLVDDLLDISRAIGGKIELHRRDIEIAELADEALEVASPLLEQRRQVMEVEVPRQGLGVRADRERMVQVISNLLTNAAKYSDQGSRITIRGTRTDDTVRLSIRDRGAGIAPEMIGRVFDPFVQQTQTLDRARGGLGLGLSIVRSLVELHGGRVAVVSEGVGRGSEFTIELPASERVSTPSPGSTAKAGERPSTPQKKILVVDDNEDAATMLCEALEHLGYQVAVAYDGPSALRIAPAFAPDVALLDLGLPVMDGFELAERLRGQQPPTKRPHLVAVTGYGQDTDRQRSIRAGFERHLVKPITIDLVSRVIAELVSGREQAADVARR
ncbi:MAG: two-component hybrid sensor and regulator [Deltaproteobacteria bacterium]|nr:two-component hybrid sensor and regulator [Deltaproteobacteria bacterium]